MQKPVQNIQNPRNSQDNGHAVIVHPDEQCKADQRNQRHDCSRQLPTPRQEHSGARTRQLGDASPFNQCGEGPEWGVMSSPIAKNMYNPAISRPDNRASQRTTEGKTDIRVSYRDNSPSLKRTQQYAGGISGGLLIAIP